METVDAVLQQSLKASKGPDDWKRFFALASSVFALEEGCSPTPGFEDSEATSEELKHLFDSLKVETVLGAYRKVMQVFQQQEWKSAYYFLLHLDPEERRLEVFGFEQDRLIDATEMYATLEKREAHENSQTVLVVADSLKALKRAYPNYYLDTHEFVSALKKWFRR